MPDPRATSVPSGPTAPPIGRSGAPFRGTANPFRRARPTILLVDDTPANIDVLVGLLQADYTLRIAKRGEAALRICAAGELIDLILLDVMMPEMDGFEVCRRLRADPLTRDIPIIFLTARTAVEDIVRGFELGAVDYVAKPFNAAELLARVSTHLTVHRLSRENERLLLSILPGSVAGRLKSGEERIADSFAQVSVLFADLVEFTPLSGRLPPQALVELLNDLFTRFDELAFHHRVEKIKTIGDCYMAVCGLPEPVPDHARQLAATALSMLETLAQFNAGRGTCLQIRVGLHTGPVVAGVVGCHKFIYDLWGDTVNTGSRMESSGVPGRIQVTQAMRDALATGFEFEPRGEIEIKGKGMMPTWFLLGPRPGA
jgi:adenylate cyclase